MTDPKSDALFSPEYDPGSATASPVSKDTPSEAPTDLVVESERYGTGKPSRIVIRAKITHD